MTKQDEQIELFSDRNLQSWDKNILKIPKERHVYALIRTLKLVYSLPFKNALLVIGEVNNIFEVIIIFNEDDILKVADYKRNLIMPKNDYYKLYHFHELNVLNKFEIYALANFIKDTDSAKYMYDYLIFSKEILQELSKKNYYEYLSQKYDENGLNLRNYTWVGDNCDHIFFLTNDCYHKRYKKITEELSTFTLNPVQKTKHIKAFNNRTTYLFSQPNFGRFEFYLISDMFKEDTIKQELLSDKRYHHCHHNAHDFAKLYAENTHNEVYIVGGQLRANEIDYYYHSWVEVKSTKNNLVMDWNENLIIPKEVYYQLFEARAISKTNVNEMEEIINLTNKAGLNFNQMDLNYFGQEIKKDLLKHNTLIKK